MQVLRTELTVEPQSVPDINLVRAGQPLGRVIESLDFDAGPYAVVVDETGKPTGIVSIESLLPRVSASDPVERDKWAARPIESLMSISLTGGEAESGQQSPDLSQTCASLVNNGRLVGVATADDLLISWRMLEPILATAERDTVTGLVTRSAFLRAFECELDRARRSAKRLTILLIDIDFFKSVNDLAGHATGDAVLNTIGDAIVSSVRSYDVVARFAGDEFIVMCCECGPEAVHIPIQRIQRAVAALPPQPDLPGFDLTLSIGAAAANPVSVSLTADTMLEAADRALYEAKRSDRNCAFACDLTPLAEEASALRRIATASEVPDPATA